MAQLRILCWNIQDLGTDQVDDDSFLDMIVAVIDDNDSKADLVCILETKTDEGKRLGRLLATKLKTKTGKTWAFDSSPKSGPSSNKPENYVFLWDTNVVTNAAGWKIADLPATLGFPNKHIKCRFPYLGRVTVNGRTITMIAFHTCFERVDIVESNQNLALIQEFVDDPNVIVMGDFNDKAVGGRPKRRGRQSFDDFYTAGYLCALDVLTSLKTKKGAANAIVTSDTLLSYYDHFFWRTKAGQLANPVAKVVDLLESLRSGKYLHDLGKAVFNNWAKRKNAEAATPVAIKQRKLKKRPLWVDIPTFLPTDTILDIRAAHRVYFDSVSDHLPIHMVIDVS